MKYFLAFTAAFFFSSLDAFASANGGNLIGLSPASQSMGGTGVANFTNGTDAIYKNPALLSESTNAAGKVGGELFATYFNQNASVRSQGNAGVDSGVVDTQAKGRLAPQIAASYKVDDKLAFGFGILGFGGAVADYTGNATAPNGSNIATTFGQLKTTLNLTRIAPAVSYRVLDQLVVGLSPFLTYGEFLVNEDVEGPPFGTQSARARHGKVGVGAEAGVSSKVTDDLTLGATITTKSKLSFDNILPLDNFGPNVATSSGVNGLTIEQPLEVAVGGSYKISSELSATADFRFINWSKAQGYSDLEWNDQYVFGAGAQYKIMEKLMLRAGYNYGKSPIQGGSEVGTNQSNVQGHQVFALGLTKLNLIAFPGIAEHHITAGAGYALSESLSLDASFVYSPSVTIMRNSTTAFPTPSGSSPYTYTATVSQWSLGLGGVYRF